MFALCLMLSVTYYAQNYAGIIGWSLIATYLATNHHSYMYNVYLEPNLMQLLVHC